MKLDSGAIILISNRMINEFRLENLAIFTLLTNGNLGLKVKIIISTLEQKRILSSSSEIRADGALWPEID